MAKLDENYLDLVRQSLYTKQSKSAITVQKQNRKPQQKAGSNNESASNSVPDHFKNKKGTFKAKNRLKKKEKKETDPKKVTFLNTTSEKTPESIDIQKGTLSSVKNRVATPYKTDKLSNKLKKKQTVKLLNHSELKEVKTSPSAAKKFSPSLNEVEQFDFSSTNAQEDNAVKYQNNNGKSKKRRLSLSENPEVKVKRHKEKPISKKGVRLIFDESIDDDFNTLQQTLAKNFMSDSNDNLGKSQQTLAKNIGHDKELNQTKLSKKKKR